MFTLQFNQWAKHQKNAEQLWPLSIDNNSKKLTADEMYERNRKIIEMLSRN